MLQIFRDQVRKKKKEEEKKMEQLREREREKVFAVIYEISLFLVWQQHDEVGLSNNIWIQW